MVALVFRRDGMTLVPIDGAGRKLLRRVQPDDLVTVEARVPRNLKWHNKYWKLCALIAENTTKLRSADEASDLLKIGAGHCRLVETGDGIIKIPLSISFQKMDQQEFEAFWDAVCAFVLTEIWPHITRPDLERQLAEFVGVGALIDSRG